jgi:hypothetical protein
MKRNDSLSACSTENFTLYIKKFHPSDNSLATQTGYMVATNRLYSSTIIDKIIFMKPEAAPNPSYSGIKPNDKIFIGFSQLLSLTTRDEWFERIIRSIKIFRTAYLNTAELSYFDRLLLMVTAIQSLFEKAEHNGKKLSKMIVDTFQMNDRDSELKKLQDYFEKVYILRSRYTHGNKMPNLKKIETEYGNLFLFLVRLFSFLITSILQANGYGEYDLEHDIQFWKRMRLVNIMQLMDETAE